MQDSVSLRFLGGTGTVTGSRFLVSTPDTNVLVDCGLYQGSRELRRRNWAPFPVPIHEIDAVILTHAHLDHCGYLPRLARRGYQGPIFCSPWTAKVAPIVLRDAAHLQEEDAEFAARRGYSKHNPPLPLFTVEDAEKAISLLRVRDYGIPVKVGSDTTVQLHRAGHILGSSTVEIRAAGRTIVFSGDLGRGDHPLLSPPEPLPVTDAVVIESTYGNEVHGLRNPAEIVEPINRALARGGSVLIPAFAIDRTPVLLMALRDLMRAGDIPQTPVYVDSPMALAALEVYREAVSAGGPEIRPEVRNLPADPFDPGELHLVPDAEASRRLNEPSRPCIIVSASGMATGGRVVHHLQHMLPNPRHLVLLPGYQVPGTRGSALLAGAMSLKMFGEYVPVRAEVVGSQEFSAHADANDLIKWLHTTAAEPRACYVVHGEPDSAAALAERISTDLGWCGVVPQHGERVLVGGRHA